MDHGGDLLDDICDAARVTLRVGLPRDQIEGAVAEWYGMLGLTPPAVFWASSPRRTTLILGAVRSALLAVADSRHQLPLVAAHEAALRLAPSLEPEYAEAIAEFAATTVAADPGRPLTDIVEPLARRTRASIEATQGSMYADVVRTRVSAQIGQVRTAVLALAGGPHDWFAPVDERLAEVAVRPLLPRLFAPEEIELYRRRREPFAAQWRGWATVSQGVTAWWAMRGCAVLCAPPDVVDLDAQGRPHGERGPALAWSDGDERWAWHGTQVPRTLIEGAWSSETIMHTANVEVRRCAIERIGWEKFVADMGFRRMSDPVPDPANPGYDLSLYHVPGGIVGGGDFQLLLCTNASIERDGTRRRYGIAVPWHVHDPLSAAAWTFGLEASQYATLAAAS